MGKYHIIDTHDHSEITYDAYASVSAPNLAFLHAASKALTDFRNKWRDGHSGDNYAKDLEMDEIPVTYDGEIWGFLIISEIDGASYDFAPMIRTKAKITAVDEA